MGLSFTRAPTVAAGDAITSTQMRALARAFNDRIRSGLGDCAWRIAWWWWSMWHDVRNPIYLGPEDLIGSWAPQDEALAYYIHLPKSAIGWPDGDAGEEGGPNVVNPLIGWVFGNAAVGYYDETGRLGSFPLRNAVSAAEAWSLAKEQRGAYDPDTGNQNVPAFQAAQSFQPIVWGNINPARNVWGADRDLPSYQQTWGGMMPSPPWVGTCEDMETPEFELRLTPLREGLPLLTYSSCTHYIITSPLAYFVCLVATAELVAEVSRADYIEGPYQDAATPARNAGDQLQRLFHSYAASMRGTASQRASGAYDVDVYAFDWERFLASQYWLAPALGVTSGGSVVAQYNTHEFTGAVSIAAGTESSPHLYRSGYVRAGCFIEASGLTAPCDIEIMDGATVLRTVTCAASYHGSLELWESYSEASVVYDLRVRLKTTATFSSTDGYIRVEANEVMAYRPQLHDAFFVARMLCAQRQTMDRDGSQVSVSREASDNWFRFGCLNSTGEIYPADYASENGLLENARKWTRENIRCIPREMIQGYEVVVENGVEKSVLHIDRYHYVSGVQLDVMEGIVDAIEHTAEVRGTTNEWVMVHQLCPYGISDSNVLKPEVMADHFGLVDRCHFYDTQSISDKPWRRNIGWMDSIAWAPQAPTGYRYYPSNNPRGLQGGNEDSRRRFYKSCQVYEAPDEIERAEAYTLGGGDFVRVVFTRRFQHTSSAPAAPVTRDFHLWDADAIAADATSNYRTLENGIMEYMLRQKLGIECQRAVIGDTSARSYLWDIYGTARGACFPKLYFIRLVPEPYEDSNDFQDKDDTACTFDAFLQMDAYLAAMCEGFVDGMTSVAYSCQTAEGTAFDYSYARLCAEAFGDASVGLLPHAIRSDQPLGHGPLPRTKMYAEVFNRFSSAVNLLTKCRIWLTVEMEAMSMSGGTRSLVAVQNGCGGSTPCSDSIITAANETPPCPSMDASGDWNITTVIQATATGSLYAENSGGAPQGTVCDGTSAWLYGSKTGARYRFRAATQESLDALPEIIRNMVDSYQIGMVCTLSTTTQTEAYVGLVSDVADATQCDGNPIAICGGQYGQWAPTITQTTTCGLFSNGTLDAGCPLASDFWRIQPGVNCSNASIVSLELTPRSGVDSVYVEASLA